MIDSYALTGIFFAVERRAVVISDHTHAYFVNDSDEIDIGMISKEMELIREGLDLAEKVITEYQSSEGKEKTQ